MSDICTRLPHRLRRRRWKCCRRRPMQGRLSFSERAPGESQTMAGAGIVSDSLIAFVGKGTDVCPCHFPKARLGHINGDASPFFQEQRRHIIQSTPPFLCPTTPVEIRLWLIARLYMFLPAVFRLRRLLMHKGCFVLVGDLGACNLCVLKLRLLGGDPAPYDITCQQAR